MQFNQVAGQDEVKALLISNVRQNRVSHAQLFHGQPGTGALALAIAYAQYISCEDKRETDSCGVCPACAKYQKLAHPDLHFVYPVTTTKTITKDPVSDDFLPVWREALLKNPYLSEAAWYDAIGVENKQGIIGKNESEAIIRKLNLKTFEAESKIMIIWLPEKMNQVAANKLLKIIEEPPQKTLFLLVSEEPGKMISTILSRTQMISVSKLTDEAIRKALLAGYSFSGEELQDIVHLANGSLLKAIEVIESTEEARLHFEMFVQLMRLSYSKNVLGLLKWVDEISVQGREKLKAFLQYALRIFRESFIMNYGQPGMSYVNRKEEEFCRKFAPFITEANIFSIGDELNKACEHIESNGYAKIVLTDMVLKMVKLIKV